MSLCQSLILRPHRQNIRKDIVAGDERWALHFHHTQRRKWLLSDKPPPGKPKGGQREKKILSNRTFFLNFPFLNK
ncbi:unnamed protein product [Heligmosomoides polygyrus]|uniref:Uncharacterized protein n=1 Tax=Heligmosomoides polygyrus TaxID=6339 RepID=A0A183GH20_HELPZ|nr:unnamed protein product [Heligmosomoides polygyrus]